MKANALLGSSPRSSRSFSFSRLVPAAVAAVLLVLSTAHCSGSSTSGTGTASSAVSGCETVCDCVAAKNGNRASCVSQCQQIVTSSNTDKSDCEAALASNGFSSCDSTCSVFDHPAPAPSGSGSTSSGSSGGPPATRADFCAKCAECVVDSTFDEGFCNPFKTSGGGFDTSSCIANGKNSSLANPSLAASTLSAMSCAAFDEAE